MPNPTAEATLRRTRFDAEPQLVGDTAVVRLRGELDVATAPRLRQILAAALDEGHSAVVLDLSDLTFLDTSGVRVLRAACTRAMASGCSFALRAPGRAVRRTLSLTGVDRVLDIEVDSADL